MSHYRHVREEALKKFLGWEILYKASPISGEAWKLPGFSTIRKIGIFCIETIKTSFFKNIFSELEEKNSPIFGFW